MSQRVLVTGVRGFTDRYMVCTLQALGYEVWGLSNDQDLTLASYQIFSGDLTQPNLFEAAVKACQPHYVIHLAGIAFIGHSSPTAFLRSVSKWVSYCASSCRLRLLGSVHASKCETSVNKIVIK